MLANDVMVLGMVSSEIVQKSAYEQTICISVQTM